jgi:putative tricarboxylic transport membrane protein
MNWKKGLGAALLLAGSAVALQTQTALADSWQPKRPVEVVVPSAPGGGQDLAARTLQGVMEQLKVSPKPIIF